jgi:hypothetical protein
MTIQDLVEEGLVGRKRKWRDIGGLRALGRVSLSWGIERIMGRDKGHEFNMKLLTEGTLTQVQLLWNRFIK